MVVKVSRFTLFAFMLLISCSSEHAQDEFKPDAISGATANPEFTFKETHVLAIGDSIIVFGGNKGFLSSEFDKDTCAAKVVEIYFSKEIGQVAFIDFKEDTVKQKSYSLNLYYWNSSRGYELSSLRKWEKIFTKEDRDKFGPLIKCPLVDHGIGFNYFR